MTDMDSFFSPSRFNFGSPAPDPAPTATSTNARIDEDTSKSLFGFAPRATFAGNPNASTASAWSFGARPFGTSHAAFAPSQLRLSASTSSMNGIPSASLDTLASSFRVFASSSVVSKMVPGVKELSGEALDAATTADPAALIQGVEVLRIYTEVDEMPFALLDALLAAQSQSVGTLRELHICIQLHLRPALQDVQNSLGIKRALTSTMRKWATSSTVLKFYFLLPHITTRPEHVSFDDYQKVDVWTAVAGLDEATNELTDILRKAEGPESIARMAGTAVTYDVGDNNEDAMELDGWL